MSDFSRGWRPSSNVRFQRPEALRTAWLEESAQAPDDWRAQQGLSPVSQATRDVLFRQMADERPIQQTGEALFGAWRQPAPRALGIDPAHQAASAQRYPNLGEPSFREQNSSALLGKEIAQLLGGQAVQPTRGFLGEVARTPTTAGFLDALDQSGGVYAGASPLEGSATSAR